MFKLNIMKTTKEQLDSLDKELKLISEEAEYFNDEEKLKLLEDLKKRICKLITLIMSKH